VLDKELISLIVSGAAGVFVAIGLWGQASVILHKKSAWFCIVLKYVGIISFLGGLWIFPSGVILDGVVFFLMTVGSLLLAWLRRKFLQT
jgi:hypothetical protein